LGERADADPVVPGEGFGVVLMDAEGGGRSEDPAADDCPVIAMLQVDDRRI